MMKPSQFDDNIAAGGWTLASSLRPCSLGADPFANDVIDDAHSESIGCGYSRPMPAAGRPPTLFEFAEGVERAERAAERHGRTQCISMHAFAIGNVGDADFGRPR